MASLSPPPHSGTDGAAGETEGSIVARWTTLPARLLKGELPGTPALAARLLLAFAVTQALFLGLAEAAARAFYPDIHPTDLATLAAVHDLASPALTLLFLALTTVGGGAANVPLAAACGWLLAARQAPVRGIALLLVMAGAAVLEGATKLALHRARPDLFRLAAASGYSFPSGHALGATALYGWLALSLWSRVTSRWGRAGLLALAILMPLGIGLSRVYLGVHYPSDVLGGWTAGLLWLGAASLAVRAPKRSSSKPL